LKVRRHDIEHDDTRHDDIALSIATQYLMSNVIMLSAALF
jgi:hypothetical protein